MLIRNLSSTLAAGVIAIALAIGNAGAAGQGLLAVVNDQPITSYDIDQQIQLMSLLGASQPSRKKALNDIINQVVKINEATRYKMNASDVEIDSRLKEFAKSLKTDDAGMESKMQKQGISMDAMRQYIAAQIGFARLLKYKYKESIEVKPDEVDRKLGDIKQRIDGQVTKIMRDPRMKQVEVISLKEILFPVEASAGAQAQVFQSRAIEANGYISRFNGCKNAQAAAAGIFNVKVGKTFDADAARLPKELLAALEAKGPDHVVGPMRAKEGIQVIAYCGKRTLSPPKPKVSVPSRQQVEQIVLSEKFDSVEEKYVALMRKNAIIEYKDASYAQ